MRLVQFLFISVIWSLERKFISEYILVYHAEDILDSCMDSFYDTFIVTESFSFSSL